MWMSKLTEATAASLVTILFACSDQLIYLAVHFFLDVKHWKKKNEFETAHESPLFSYGELVGIFC
jgi:hypothetical protein